MSDAEAQLRAQAESDGVEFFFAMFVDMHGKPCAKMIPVEATEVLTDGGAGFAGFAAGPMGQSPADPDMIAVPDLASYAVAPWAPQLAVVQCDIHVDGEPWPPRLHGTGTEDYFGLAFCPTQEYAAPYHGLTVYSGTPEWPWGGKNSMYRFHVEDPIRFRSSIRVTIETGHDNAAGLGILAGGHGARTLSWRARSIHD